MIYFDETTKKKFYGYLRILIIKINNDKSKKAFKILLYLKKILSSTFFLPP